MNYIYDILLNFSDTIYDFYDWNPNDNIINIRKIPLIKLSNIQMRDIKSNIIKFECDFLKRIKNKTEIFTNKDVKYLEHSCLFSDGLEVLAVSIKGGRIQKSHLLIDEEIEALEVVSRLKEETVTYHIVKRDKVTTFKTRNELAMEKTIRSGLKKLLEEKDLRKLRYLYYECFDEKEDNPEKIVIEFQKNLDKKFDQISKKLFDFLKLMQVHK